MKTPYSGRPQDQGGPADWIIEPLAAVGPYKLPHRPFRSTDIHA